MTWSRALDARTRRSASHFSRVFFAPRSRREYRADRPAVGGARSRLRLRLRLPNRGARRPAYGGGTAVPVPARSRRAPRGVVAAADSDSTRSAAPAPPTGIRHRQRLFNLFGARARPRVGSEHPRSAARFDRRPLADVDRERRLHRLQPRPASRVGGGWAPPRPPRPAGERTRARANRSHQFPPRHLRDPGEDGLEVMLVQDEIAHERADGGFLSRSAVGANRSSSAKYGSRCVMSFLCGQTFRRYRNPIARMYGESPWFSRCAICVSSSICVSLSPSSDATLGASVNRRYRMQNAVDGPRALPLIHGSTCVTSLYISSTRVMKSVTLHAGGSSPSTRCSNATPSPRCTTCRCPPRPSRGESGGRHLHSFEAPAEKGSAAPPWVDAVPADPRVAPRTPLTSFHAVHGQPPRVRAPDGRSPEWRTSHQIRRASSVSRIAGPAQFLKSISFGGGGTKGSRSRVGATLRASPDAHPLWRPLAATRSWSCKQRRRRSGPMRRPSRSPPPGTVRAISALPTFTRGGHRQKRARSRTFSGARRVSPGRPGTGGRRSVDGA